MNAAKQLRQKILDLAIRGQLVPQNPKDEPAEKLLQRIWEEKLNAEEQSSMDRACRSATAAPQPIPDDEKPFDLPKGWAWCRLGGLAKIVSKGTTPKGGSNAYVSTGICYIRAENVGDDGLVHFDNVRYITAASHNIELKRSILYKNDLLITIAGSLGRAAVYKGDDCKANTNQAIAFVRIHDDLLIDVDYLLLTVLSPSIQNILLSQQKVTGIPNLTLEIISRQIIPLPPLAEQKRIVAKVEALLKDVEKYERAVEGLTGAADDLSKKILDLAIRGQLTKRDPKDEPAEKLLQRIWEGRAPSRPEGRGRTPYPPSEASCEAGAMRGAAPHSPRSTRPTQPPPIPDDEKPFALPKGWAWCRLGDVFDHNTGKALNRNDSKGCMREYITTSNVYWDHFELSVLKKMPIEKCELDRFSIKKGDLLVCEGGDIGRANIWQSDQTVCFQNHIHRLRPYVSVEIRFFYYVFRLYKATGRIKGKGIGMLGLSANALHNMLIPLPPLAEQKRIVAKVEELLSDVDRLKKGAA